HRSPKSAPLCGADVFLAFPSTRGWHRDTLATLDRQSHGKVVVTGLLSLDRSAAGSRPIKAWRFSKIEVEHARGVPAGRGRHPPFCSGEPARIDRDRDACASRAIVQGAACARRHALTAGPDSTDYRETIYERCLRTIAVGHPHIPHASWSGLLVVD